MAEPRRSLLYRLLKTPGARDRLGPAVARLLGISLVSVAAVGALTIWHLVRRGRLIRERLSPPRVVRLPDLEFDERAAGSKVRNEESP
jgi:hypothetical protein